MSEVEIRLSNNDLLTFKSTEYIETTDGLHCRVSEMKGKRLMPTLKECLDIDLEFMLFGFVQGDGQLTRLNSDTHKGLEVNVGKNDQEVKLLFKNTYETTEAKDGRGLYVSGIKDKLASLGFCAEVLPIRVMPSTYKDWDIKRKASFLRGCYSANGSVINVGRIAYKTTCRQFAEELQEALLNDFGINAYITTNKSHDVKFSNGTYTLKESYDVNIQQYASRVKFYNTIGFIHRYKMDKLRNKLIDNALIVRNVTIK